jgi:hypothetical protein
VGTGPEPPDGGERFTQSAILAAHGSRNDCKLWRVNTLVAFRDGRPVRSVPVGHPDIAGVGFGGLAIFIEVKRVGGKLSPEQRAFRDAVESVGARYLCANSVQQVTDFLDRLSCK